MLSLYVKVSEEYREIAAEIRQKTLKEAFFQALKEAEPDLLASKATSDLGSGGIIEGDSFVTMELGIDDEVVVTNFSKIAGLNHRQLMSLIFVGVIRTLVLQRDERDVRSQKFDIEDDDDEESAARMPLTECCRVEALDDGLGTLMCTYCGAFIPNRALGTRGCPACGSYEIDFDGHCQVCFAYIGPRTGGYQPTDLDTWVIEY